MTGRSAASFSAVTMYALATPSEWKAHQAGYHSIQTTQSKSLRSTTLRILSLFHSSYWIETVTAPIFNRAGTAKVGGPSTVASTVQFSSVSV